MRFADKRLELLYALSQMKRKEDGNVTIFSIFMLLLILLFTGAAVDIMRFEAVRTKMQSAMDRAVLAAADLDQQQDPKGVVENYLARSGITNVNASVSVTEGVNHRTVVASGDSELDTFFLRMSGIDNLTAPASSTAEEKISNVEISMVLDISGSMRFNSRMDQMKPAAKDFIDKVMTDESNGVTTLNLVPFAGHVNPGDILFEYYRGERPKINENNGWGNGDQDAPGGSLCNNNAENADEGDASAECSGEETTTTEPTPDENTNGYFSPWNQAISNMVFYFDSNADGEFNGRTDIAHKIEGFPEDAPRDADDFFKGAVAYLMANDPDLNDPAQFLGASIKGGRKNTKYFQVKGDENGDASDLGPTKNKGKIPGNTYQYSSIDYVAWAVDFVDPNPEDDTAPTSEEVASDESQVNERRQNINMPSSCLEIYDHEFQTTDMPTSDDYVPHFMYWPIDEDTMDWGWCPDDDAAIQYYSDDPVALKSFVDDLRMHDGTGGQFGMKYGLALLDPDTRDAISHLIRNDLVAQQFEGRPMAWEDQETEKFILFMTDGGITDQYRPTKPKAAINGEVDLQTQGSGSYQVMETSSTNTAQFLEQCELAKQLGVTVFTVAFQTNNSTAETVKSCASSESHFFHVTDGAIDDAFDTIARQINNLRLIQ